MMIFNPRWADSTGNNILLTIKEPNQAEYEYVASSKDVVAHGVELYRQAMAGAFGEIKAYTPPPPKETAEDTTETENTSSPDAP